MEARVQVTPIFHDVRDNGDAALRRLTERLDGVTLGRLTLEDWEWRKQASTVSKQDRALLEQAAARLREWHESLMPQPRQATIAGARVARRPVPLDRVGVYVPGRTEPDPFALLASAVPAKVAGVPEVIACTPPRSAGSIPAILLAAADIAGVDEIYRVGGAQAIFAMAWGTVSVPPVQKVVGSGNVYVQAAKLLAQGQVGTDGVTGPNELMIIADASAGAEEVAWEVAAHAEQEPTAVTVLLTTRAEMVGEVQATLEAILPKLARGEIAARSLKRSAALLSVESLGDAVAYANSFAPAQLCLWTRNPGAVLRDIRAAGSVIVGPSAALARYAGFAGPLPSSHGARFASSLGPADFVRWIQAEELPAGKRRDEALRLAEVHGRQGSTQALGAGATKRQSAKGRGKKL